MNHSDRADSSQVGENWAVVGGGILGMTIALRLTQRGHRVTLIEGRQNLGGMADAWQLGDIVWDRHYHVTLLSDAFTCGLLKELDLQDQMQWVVTKTGFFTDGQLHSMSNSLEFLTFPPLGLIDKLRLGGTIFYASRVKNWNALEIISVCEFLTKLSGKRTFEKIWRPLLRAKLGESYKETSAAFIWATIARMYAARRSGLKKEMFGYVRGGYATVMDRFKLRLEQSGVRILCNAAVRGIQSVPNGQVQVQLADESSRFDRVVSTLPSPAVSRLCSQLPQKERSLHDGIRYHGIVCASVLLRKGLSPYYVTNITDGGVPFTAVIDMSALVSPDELRSNGLVYLPRYVAPDDELFDKSDAEIELEFIAGLQRMHPGISAGDVRAFRVSRIRHVFALPTTGFSDRLPSIQTGVPNLYAVNSAHIVNSTLNVNETIRLAEEFVKTYEPHVRLRQGISEEQDQQRVRNTQRLLDSVSTGGSYGSERRI